MALDSNVSAAYDTVFLVERLYAGLIQFANAGHSSVTGEEPSLGGNLLYAGELDEQGRALVVAGNIAGAASLAATADPAAQKQAIRDGVTDFLVTSLDEALRILKNEIRKRQTVAVCVSAAPADIQCEMQERGVQPDLVRESVTAAADLREATHFGLSPTGTQALISWTVAAAPAQWLPKVDAIALECLGSEAGVARRWLRFAPRYLGRMAHGLRLLRSDGEFATVFAERVREQVQRGDIGVPVEIRVGRPDGCEEHLQGPANRTKTN